MIAGRRRYTPIQFHGSLERITNYRERVFLVFPVKTDRRVGRMSVRLALAGQEQQHGSGKRQ